MALTVVFTEMKFEHMQSIIEYLYTGETRMESTKLEDFFKSAKKLKIFGLYESTESDAATDNASISSTPTFSVTYELPSSDSDQQSAVEYRSKRNTLARRAMPTATISTEPSLKCVHFSPVPEPYQTQTHPNPRSNNAAQNANTATSTEIGPHTSNDTNQNGTAKENGEKRHF